MGIKSILLAVAGLTLSINVNAVPITITQTFYNTSFDLTIDGSQQLVTGDWIFKGVTDTDSIDTNPNVNTGYYATTVTLTQSSLGLVDELVTNLNNLFVGSSIVGFTGSGFSRTVGTFSNPDLFPSLAELTIAQNTSPLNTLGQQYPGFQLANGMLIQSLQSGLPSNTLYNNLSSSMNAQISAVPIPAAVWLFGSGLIGLVGLARRKAHS